MYLEKGVGRMKLKFVDQPYQTDAVNAICDIFDGCEVKDSLFTIEVDNHNKLNFDTEGVDYFIGHSNKLSIDDFTMLDNVQNIQERNDIQMAKDLQKRNFTIEMETGTGKTYVYTKTILELNKRYGFTKFIIVVPSIAIKEGVNSSLNATKEHFMESMTTLFITILSMIQIIWKELESLRRAPILKS